MNGILDNSEWQVPAFDVHEFKRRTTKYCVCIPVINEGDRLKNQLQQMSEQKLFAQADVLILDGGSTDGSTDLESLSLMGVRTLLIKTGAGRLSAQLRMGYAWALQQGYQGIITVDGNGKDGVEAIPAFIRELDAGSDLVQGSRYVPGGQAINTPLVRTLAIKLLHAPVVSLAAGFWFTDTTNGFRAYSRRYLLHPDVQPFRNEFSTYELLAYLSVKAPRLGLLTKEIPVRRQYPDKGKTPTKISFVKGNFLLLQILFYILTGRFDPVRLAENDAASGQEQR